MPNENLAVPIDLKNPSVVEVVLNDKEIRKLPVGSEEFTNAVNQKLNTKVEKQEEVPAAIPETNKDESKDYDSKDGDEKSIGKVSAGTRIRELRQEREAARKEAETLRRENEQLRSNTSAKTEPKKDSDTVDYSKGYTKPAPKAADYKTNADYIDAKVDWELDKRDFVTEQKRLQSAAQSEQQKTATTWQSREIEVKKHVADYDAVVNVDSVKILDGNPDSARYLGSIEEGPTVLYKLLEDEALTKQWIESPGYMKVAMLGAIQKEVEHETSKKTSTTKGSGTDNPSKPTPPPKLRNGSNTKSASDDSLSGKDFESYDRIRSAQEKVSKAARAK